MCRFDRGIRHLQQTLRAEFVLLDWLLHQPDVIPKLNQQGDGLSSKRIAYIISARPSIGHSLGWLVGWLVNVSLLICYKIGHFEANILA